MTARFGPGNGGPGWDLARRRVTPEQRELQVFTIRWMARLPGACRPIELGRLFPCIANMLALYWDDPVRCRAYLSGLLMDKRGDRQGFPTAIAAEIFALSVLHETQFPTKRDKWDEVQPDRLPAVAGDSLPWKI